MTPMNLTIIEEEIYKFNKDFFYDISQIAEQCIDFTEQNHLHIPKENYTIVGNFLAATLKSFRVIDSTFMSPTLKKISKDVKTLQNLCDSVSNETQNLREIFESEFIKSSPSFSSFAREVLRVQSIRIPSDEDRKERKKLSIMMIELKAIYYKLFEEIFNEDKKYFLSLLKQALNSKTYYFDKLLWHEASKSNVITKHFQILKIKNALNTKDYLLYTTGLMRPYTKEYQYLQSCLRIYK